jgi:hypothetical protein
MGSELVPSPCSSPLSQLPHLPDEPPSPQRARLRPVPNTTYTAPLAPNPPSDSRHRTAHGHEISPCCQETSRASVGRRQGKSNPGSTQPPERNPVGTFLPAPPGPLKGWEQPLRRG